MSTQHRFRLSLFALLLMTISGRGRAEQPTSAPAASAPYRNPSLAINARVADLLGRMTLQEKLGQLHQGHSVPLKGTFDVTPYAEQISTGATGSLIWTLEDPADRNRLQHVAVEQSRLGIPLVFGMDVIHGYRTIFPISAGLSCGWDPDLYRTTQAVAAREARAAGVDWVFAPMSDVARDPRWGRVAETCGEDPYLTSQCVAAAVVGLQGETSNGQGPIGADHVAACLKHFVGYSAAVGGRDYNATDLSEFTLRNVHLPSFRAGVHAGAMTVMSSFNAVDGIPMVANHHTLTDILRGEWGFGGVVVSDWQAVAETIDWGYAKDDAAAARLAILAGNDVEMLSNTYSTLPAEIAAGRVPVALIDQAVRRMLTLKFRLRLFDHPYVDEQAYPAAILHPDDLQLARAAVSKSAVLLKNSGVLPLSRRGTKLALIGPFGDDAQEMIGCWGGKGHAQYVITLAAGVRAKLADPAALRIVQGCDMLEYVRRTRTLTDGTIVPDDATAAPAESTSVADAVAAARAADVAILALGEPAGWTGENASRATLGFTGRQQELFDAVAATGKPTVVVVFSGRPLSLPIVTARAAAVIYAWQPGVQAGNGLADLLFGDVPFTGRLTQTVVAAVGQVPLFYNRDTTGRPDHHMGQYRDATAEPLFPFGFGLTGGSVSYSPADLVQNSSASIAATAGLHNSSAVAVDEVVQLYVRQLACQAGVRPGQELRGFRHVTVPPHGTVEVRFPLTDEVLGYWRRDGSFIVDDGDYQLWIAPHAGTGEPARYHHGT